MTDITRKLELLANVKNGDPWPAELGPEFNNWGNIVSAICAEALAEIRMLSVWNPHINTIQLYPQKEMKPTFTAKTLGDWAKSLKNLPDVRAGHQVADLPPMSGRSVSGVGGFLPVYPQTPSAPEPTTEPWGSSFAMNTENWK